MNKNKSGHWIEVVIFFFILIVFFLGHMMFAAMCAFGVPNYVVAYFYGPAIFLEPNQRLVFILLWAFLLAYFYTKVFLFLLKRNK